MENETRTVEYSLTETVHSLRPTDINGYGRLFGGQLMQWIDEMAGIVARRHSSGQVTTASVDNLVFKKGAYINQILVMIGRVTYVGRTSMEIRVDTYVEDEHGTRAMINHAYVVMVSIDKDGRALSVPGLDVRTESERAEWEGGKRRYALRKERRKEGY
ncbi:MAG: acyl-CoA thioesterase [Hespellia sp.]|nr:acyl-CoA thioesterase [Hespellia sp.]